MGIELKPVRTGSFPLMNIAEDYGLPLDVVYPYADGVRQNELRFVMGAEQNNDDVRHIRAYAEAAMLLDKSTFVHFHYALCAQVHDFLVEQKWIEATSRN